MGADVVTFGTIRGASAKTIAKLATGSSILDISKKFASATRALSIFSKAARPVSDGAKVLVTGYETIYKIRSDNCKITKLSKSSLMVITDSINEFDKSNMLMMAVTEAYWSKSKIKYCSPKEFAVMVRETIITHVSEQCSDAGMFEDLRLQAQNDQVLVEVYKHLDENLDLNDIVKVLSDIYHANNGKMEIEIHPKEFEISLGNVTFNIQSMC